MWIHPPDKRYLRSAMSFGGTCLPRQLNKIQNTDAAHTQLSVIVVATVGTSNKQSPRLLLGDSVLFPYPNVALQSLETLLLESCASHICFYYFVCFFFQVLWCVLFVDNCSVEITNHDFWKGVENLLQKQCHPCTCRDKRNMRINCATMLKRYGPRSQVTVLGSTLPATTVFLNIQHK